MLAPDSRRSGNDTSLPELYILGGRYRSGGILGNGFSGFDTALILALSPDGAYLRTAVEYKSPAAVCPVKDGAVLFKAGSIEDRLLYVCTETEILVYRVPEFTLANYLSLPQFNDLHHVRPSREGSLLVASTGLDAVFELSSAGERLREWDLSGRGLWTRFDRAIDYRTIVSLKPRLVHPNFVFVYREEIWVTRLQQRDALRLTPSEARIALEIERPHDGIVLDDKVFFTIVEGQVVRADLARHRVEAVFDMAEIYDTRDPIGWCRGLKVLDERRVIVGFSRLRPTRWQSNVGWVARKLKQAGRAEAINWEYFPTHISCIDLWDRKILWRTNLEPYGLNAVFAIL